MGVFHARPAKEEATAEAQTVAATEEHLDSSEAQQHADAAFGSSHRGAGYGSGKPNTPSYGVQRGKQRCTHCSSQAV